MQYLKKSDIPIMFHKYLKCLDNDLIMQHNLYHLAYAAYTDEYVNSPVPRHELEKFVAQAYCNPLQVTTHINEEGYSLLNLITGQYIINDAPLKKCLFTAMKVDKKYSTSLFDIFDSLIVDDFYQINTMPLGLRLP